MLFENEFDLTKQLKEAKNKQAICDMAYNTFCVKFVNNLRKNGFSLIERKNGPKIYYAMELPVKKTLKTKPDNFIKKSNKKRGVN